MHVGVDSDWEQKKPENAAESHTPGARFVGRVTIIATLCSEKMSFVAPRLQEYLIQMNAHYAYEIEKPEFGYLVIRSDIP